MSNFTPHIALSHQYPNLELPMDFKPDNIEILIKGTPAERAVVINTGCVALQALIQKRNEISKGNDYKEGKEEGMKEESNKWKQEKKNIVIRNDDKVKELELQLRTLQDEINRQTAINVTAETRCEAAIAEAKEVRQLEQEKINRTREEVKNETSDQLKRLTDELKNKKAEAEKAASELREAQQKFVHDMEKKLSAFRDEEKKLREQLSSESKENYEKQLNEIKSALQKEIDRQKETIESMTSNLDSANIRLREEMKNVQAVTEKASLDLIKANQKAAEDAIQAKDQKFAEILAAEQKVREELTSTIENLQERLGISTQRQANSSLKGKDNENAFQELLDKSFGSDRKYGIVPKTTESGDFIIEWKGMKFMFENKTYKKTVPKTEVEKAIRDFELNPDCDVLIFVSEDSQIVNCKRYFDITRIKDGRPAIWIGEFSHNLDKVIHLQLVGQVAEELVLSQQREKKLESGDEIVNYKKKVGKLIQSFEKTKGDLDRLLRLQKKQDQIWEELKDEMALVIARFDRRREYANGNTDNDDSDSDSEPKAKKTKKTMPSKKAPKDARSPVNGEPKQTMEEKENGIVLNEKGADGTENDESRTNDPNQPQQKSGDDKVKKFDDVNVLGSSNPEQGAKRSSTLSSTTNKGKTLRRTQSNTMDKYVSPKPPKCSSAGGHSNAGHSSNSV